MINFNGKITSRPFFVLRQFFLLAIIIAIMCLFVKKVYGEEDEYRKRYFQGVEDEIKRRHELKMVEKQTEVLARLQMLGASNVRVFNSSSTQINNKTKVKVSSTNKNS